MSMLRLSRQRGCISYLHARGYSSDELTKTDTEEFYKVDAEKLEEGASDPCRSLTETHRVNLRDDFIGTSSKAVAGGAP